ncbi:MAG: prolyl oligopeptidase family serine peptidase [Planctomycetota bacterium]
MPAQTRVVKPRFGVPRALTLTLLMASACTAPGAAAGPDEKDPYLWLEEIDSESSLSWVRRQNEKTLQRLAQDPLYPPIEEEIHRILNARDRIPLPSLESGWVYNFWQDADHVRGLWRRSRPEEYARENPAWEILLDLDALARQEDENWVWQGASVLPGSDRALVFLSRGGKDARIVREFNLARRAFVTGGFSLPEAKSRVSWFDADTLLVGTDFGPGTLTGSGYPRQVRRWRRGTPLTSAELLFEGAPGDVSVSAYTSFRPEGRLCLILRAVSFFQEECRLVRPDGTLQRVPFPEDVDFRGVFEGRLLGLLRRPWRAGERTFPAGALVALPAGAPAEAAELVLAPTERASLLGVAASRRSLYVSALENVRGRLYRLAPGPSGWSRTTVPLPDHGTVGVVSADDADELLYVRYESFTSPSTLYLLSDDSDPRPIKLLPERFDARGVRVDQFEAASPDGTRVPYFVVGREGPGPRPAILHGYGGFEIPQTPAYLGTLGKAWLERGGLYVLANIRGGGEFGPRWHQAALRENRPRAFEDFLAVAEDLIRRGLTEPRKLGLLGGSNGGILVGACLTRRPELFGAAVCQVPLLDMLRYPRLLAGRSWVAEYGDPDDPAMAAVLRSYSPYHNVRPGASYPPVLLITSTRDDRVHPGHARKMAALLESLGSEVFYYENIEGGHGAAANLKQRARMLALQYVFFRRALRA